MSNQPKYRYGNRELNFRYYGGEYIFIFLIGHGTCMEVINVFDYEKEESEIKNRDDFAKACHEWVDETWKEERENYLENLFYV